MPHTRSQGGPEFELTSSKQILRARQQVSFLDPTFDMKPPPPPPPTQTVHELASHGIDLGDGDVRDEVVGDEGHAAAIEAYLDFIPSTRELYASVARVEVAPFQKKGLENLPDGVRAESALVK
ncbi:hypothetical protein E3N88_42343 [Mikania micrantha]|uniref:Uncharacterized protein n=1 Tax=Mikania micrantha TaxID=192012 RepID=A0A5N6LI65_9ASTR|nr:hypothetical protein E3N88_42343 [Mikania micrantha]